MKKKEEWSENSMINKGVKPDPTISSPTDEKIRKKRSPLETAAEEETSSELETEHRFQLDQEGEENT